MSFNAAACATREERVKNTAAQVGGFKEFKMQQCAVFNKRMIECIEVRSLVAVGFTFFHCISQRTMILTGFVDAVGARANSQGAALPATRYWQIDQIFGRGKAPGDDQVFLPKRGIWRN